MNTPIIIECSWEVCNKVGGIYTVIESKLLEAKKRYGDNYYLVGPLLSNTDQFNETNEKEWDILNSLAKCLNINCKFGRWKNYFAKTILIDIKSCLGYREKLKKLLLIYDISTHDITEAEFDYATFGFLCGHIVDIISGNYDCKNRRIIAHFHEWMSAVGILYLNSINNAIPCFLTMHSTAIGRHAFRNNVKYNEINNYKLFADRNSCLFRYLIEQICIKKATKLITISEVCDREIIAIFGRKSDYITPNGRSIFRKKIIDERALQQKRKSQKILLNKIQRYISIKDTSDTRILLYASRAEYQNKGLDLLLKVMELGVLRNQFKHKILLICIIALHKNNILCISPSNTHHYSTQNLKVSEQTHMRINSLVDFIKKSSVHNIQSTENMSLIFVPNFVTEDDGIFNIDYLDLVSICDMTIFPSMYEPWGYTPHESAILGVPTITTSNTGFGDYLTNNLSNHEGIGVIDTQGDCMETFARLLLEEIIEILSWNDKQYITKCNRAQECVARLTWDIQYKPYITMYERP